MITKIIREARKEYGKLTQEIKARQQRRKLLEALIEASPTNETLNKMMLDCIKLHKGHASFATIVGYLRDKGVIDLPQPKISVLLSTNKALKFDRDNGEWGIA